MSNPKIRNWAGGIDNVSPPDAIPEGYARALVNLDPTPGGHIALRAGAEQLLACDDCRGAFVVGRYLVIADGSSLSSIHLDTEAVDTFTDSLPAGPLAACELNGQLYLSTPTAQYRTDGVTLRRWDVQPPAFTVAELAGGTLAGQFKVAVTALGEDGEESGAVPVVLALDGARLQVRSDDPRPLRLYVSPADSASLYYQGQILGGVALLDALTDDKARLTTAHLQSMPPAEQLVSHHSVLVGSVGPYVFLSEPMWPHLTNQATRFFQFGKDVQALVGTDGGVFVVLADSTFFISGIETDAPAQRELDCLGGTRGSGLRLPDGTGAWFSRHGLALAGADGSTAFPSRERHAPALAERAACGVLEHAGSSRVLVSLGGELRPNPRAVVGEDLADVTYAVTLGTGAVTRYTGMAFDGFASLDGSAYGWRADGVYRLGEPIAATAPIDASAVFPASDFGSNATKRLPFAWLALDTDALGGLVVSVDDGPAYEYPLMDTKGMRKAKLGKGLKGCTWQLSLELLDASHAELSVIELNAGAAPRLIT